MQLTVVGTGYVGLVTGVCLADNGNHVVCVDLDAAKVQRLAAGETPLFEPGLSDLLSTNLAAGRLRFTTDLADGLRSAEVAFVAVGTPPKADGSADLTNVELVSLAVARGAPRDLVMVIKSTVPPGTCDAIQARVSAESRRRISVVSNPEFLKEGDAVNDFLRPDRVVIGDADEAAGDLVEELYLPFVRNNRPILRMSRSAAELTKYAANAYLATRISFINEIAELCERLGVDVNQVRRGIGSDARIGQHFLYPGLGYGGSCFPKDVQALAASAKRVGSGAALLDAVHARNQAQRARLIGRARERLGGFAQRTIGVWGVAFKPKTDDIREAPALDIIDAVIADGGRVAVYDPKALPPLQARFGGSPGASRISYADDAYDVLTKADALFICTEWNEFRSPDFARMRELMATPLIFDGRNLYDTSTPARYGFEYHSVGRPSAKSE